MSTADKLSTIVQNEQKTIELNAELEKILYGTDTGGKSYYDEFWDGFQQQGARTNYYYSFYGHHWTDDIFSPKYNMAPSGNTNNMFSFCKVTNIKKKLEECGVKLDLSKADPAQAIFQGAKTEELPNLDLTGARGLPNLFTNAVNLKNVGVVILKEDGTQVLTDAFKSCTSLENITFKGKIGQSIDLQSCTLLTKDSITSVIGSLLDTASNMTLTLSKEAVKNAFELSVDDNDDLIIPEDSEYYSLRQTKRNWNFSYM